MKTIQFKTLFFAAIIATASVFTLSSCKKEEVSKSGAIKMEVQDQSSANKTRSAYTSVDVEVLQVQVHYENVDPSTGRDGWITLDTHAGIYDLMDLQNDVTIVLAEDEFLPVGYITQIRLILGDDNYVEKGGRVYPLLLSSQDETGLKINLNSHVRDTDRMVILLDFDADASIVEQGNGGLRLKPVVKVEDIYYIPR